MTAYIKQRNDHACGPVALINAVKWLGYPATEGLLPKLKEVCKTTYKGTRVERLNHGIWWLAQKYKIPNSAFGKMHRHITLRQIEEELRNGRAVLVNGGIKGVGYHSCVLIGVSDCGKRFWTVNGWVGGLEYPTLHYTSRRFLQHICRHRTDVFPNGLILKKVS